MTNILNNNIPSSVYADMDFTEEEELKAGIHSSQIIPKMLEKFRVCHIPTNYILLDWNTHRDKHIVKVCYDKGKCVFYDYHKNAIAAKGI